MKRLRKRMLWIVMGAVLAVFLIAALLLYLILSYSIARQSDQMTEVISQNNGQIPDEQEFNNQNRNSDRVINWVSIDDETRYRTRYFIVTVDKDNNIQGVDTTSVARIGQSDAIQFAAHMMIRNSDTGYYNNYRYRVVAKGDDTQFIFLDVTESFQGITTIMVALGLVFIVLFLAIILIFWFSSNWAIKPFIENSKRQRQFITDAGHELKTPLAVIQANTEVLQYKLGEDNKWLDSTKTQVANLSSLISQLLVLSKNEEADDNIQLVELDLSDIVTNTFNEFVPVFESKNAEIKTTFSKGIVLAGNSELLVRLISILCDNCGKYVPEKGNIRASLKVEGRYAVFKIANTDSNKEKINCRRLFDRFYRTDDSRNSSTGGHGIGLSIAYRICSQHNGKITAKQKDGMMVFTAFIPTNLKASKPKKK